MRRIAYLVLVVLLAPSALGVLSPSADVAPRWVEPDLLAAARANPAEILTVVLGFDAVPDLAPLRAAGFAVMGYDHLPVAVAYVLGADVERLLAHPGILSAALDVEVERYQLPAVPSTLPTAIAGNQGGTGDELTRSDLARGLGYDGAGIGVAIIDLGTSGLHPGLRPRALGGPMVQNAKVLVSPGKVLASQPAQAPVTLYVEDQVNSDWTDGHGTHTAGIAVGGWTEDGLLGGRAPGADLVAVGTGDMLALPWILGGLEYVAANVERYNIRVVSNSWGVEGPYNPLHPVNLATKALADADVLVIFSAGNNGPGLRTMNAYSLAPHVLAVGATTLSGAIAEFSSRGDPASGKPGPEIVAPGAEIVSGRNQWVSGNDITYRTAWADGGYIPAEHLNWYRAVSGTSMSAPQIAGIAALVLEANPALTREELTDVLLTTAGPIVGFEFVAQGAGMVDAHAAVLAALGEPVPPREVVQPTVVAREGDAFVYPFHGALLGGPDKSASGFRPRAPFPIYLPTTGATIDFSWRALGATSGLKLSVVGADGTLVRNVALDLEAGHASLALTPAEIAAHKDPFWSAAYWTMIVDLDAGAIEWDAVASVAYAGGSLPAIQHAAPPPPPPPPPRIPHAPIVIASDADFTAANGVSRGAGTIDDPYIIEGWDIDPDSGAAISIGGTLGTSAYVLIRNVRLHDTNGNCLELVRVQHLAVRDSLFDGCDFAVNLRGGADIRIEGNDFDAVSRGPSLYGVNGAVIRGNTLRNAESSGIIVGQGFTQQSTASVGIVIEDNTLVGPQTNIFVSSPASVAVEVHRNTLSAGAFIDLQIVPVLTTISDTTWIEGTPDIRTTMLVTPHPYLPLSTIVDAGSDRAAGGNVCFSDARADVAVGGAIAAIVWDFGDGNVGTTLNACHDYAPGSYEARLTATITMADGSTRVLGDSVRVG